MCELKSLQIQIGPSEASVGSTASWSVDGGGALSPDVIG